MIMCLTIISLKQADHDVPAPATWNKLDTQEISKTSSNKILNVAVNELAETVAAIVKGAAGDLGGLGEWASGFVANFGWGDEQSKNSKASIHYHSPTKTFITLILEKTEKTANSVCPCFGGSTHTLTVRGNFRVMCPRNEAAEDICDQMIRAQAEDLQNLINNERLFIKPGGAGGTPVSAFAFACE